MRRFLVSLFAEAVRTPLTAAFAILMIGGVGFAYGSAYTEIFGNRTEYAHLPPSRFQGSRDVLIRFTSAEGVAAECPGSSATVYACAHPADNSITIPNPCDVEGVTETADAHREDEFAEWYVGVLCHEMAHVNGWNHDANYEQAWKLRATIRKLETQP